MSIFGVSLEDVLRKELVVKGAYHIQQEMPAPGSLVMERSVPEILKVLVQRFEELNGYGVEGIFRRAADTDAVSVLKRKLGEGRYMVYGSEAVTTDECLVVTDLIKIWLRQLAEPLIPKEYYEKAVAAGLATNHSAAHQVLNNLPPANSATLHFLITFLNNCADQSQRNQVMLLRRKRPRRLTWY